jgi:hypothetical protein
MAGAQRSAVQLRPAVISLIAQLWTVGAAHSRDKPPDKFQADLTIRDYPGHHIVSRAWPAPTVQLFGTRLCSCAMRLITRPDG